MNLNELINNRKTGTILKLIKDGELTDSLHELKNYPDKRVRIELIKRGLYLDEYIADDNDDVRDEVFNQFTKHPEYVIHVLGPNNSYNYNAVLEYIIWLDKPDVNMLKEFINTPKPTKGWEGHDESLQYQYQALTTEVTPITQTMTRKQLFEIGNPLWANSLKAYYIQRILGLIDSAKKYGAFEYLLEHFEELSNPKTHHKVCEKIYDKYNI